MVYVPQKRKKKNVLILIYGFAILLFHLILADFNIIKSTLCHFVFFFEAVFYTFILTKFILPTYTYIIDDNKFIIIKNIGNKTVTECNIDILNIIEIVPYKQHKKQVVKKAICVYNYNANFLSSTCQCLIFEYSGICEAILFEPNKEMLDIIITKKELSSI